MPDNTVYVGRGSVWGNPFSLYEKERDGHGEKTGKKIQVRTAEEAVKLYSRMLVPYTHEKGTIEDIFKSEANIFEIVSQLKGKNLACWCALDQPCHADFLLDVANDDFWYNEMIKRNKIISGILEVN